MRRRRIERVVERKRRNPFVGAASREPVLSVHTCVQCGETFESLEWRAFCGSWCKVSNAAEMAGEPYVSSGYHACGNADMRQRVYEHLAQRERVTETLE